MTDEKKQVEQRAVCADIQSSHPPLLTFVFQSALELYHGLRLVEKHKKAITFFGSAREVLPRYYYESCETLAAQLSQKGFTIITGGGSGIMRSANKGAFQSGGHSLGITIQIPAEDVTNSFLSEQKKMKYFFTRKTALSYASQIYFFFPGGFGTFDELADMLVLIQTKKIPQVPIILFGRDFWNPLDSFIKKSLAETYKTVDKEDADIYIIVDSVDDALHCVERYCGK